MRAIDSDHVIARLDEIQPFAGNKAANASINLAKDVVRNAPTLSPDDVGGVGEWIEDRMRIKCSACGTDFSDEVTCCPNCYRWPWNYCPSCGARMTRAEAEKAMEVTDDA